MEEDIYRSQFRLPYTLYELLKASADENHRSVNAELVARLESSFKKMDLVRHSLGFPIAESSTDQQDAQDVQIRPFSGPSKDKLLDSIDDAQPGTPISKEELWRVFDKVFNEILGGSHVIPGSESSKTHPNNGPKPRKRYPKE